MGKALAPGLARRDPSARTNRDVIGGFDGVASLGMFEHVGYKNYRKFFEVARRGCVLAASFISLPSGPTALRVPPILGSTNTFFRIRICRQPRKLRQGWRACLSLKIGRTGQLRPQDCGLVSELSKALEKPATPLRGTVLSDVEVVPDGSGGLFPLSKESGLADSSGASVTLGY